jgi:hypothetical protein
MRTEPKGIKCRLVFYPQFCYDCGCTYVSDKRHARCWNCNATDTINCFRERYEENKWTRYSN